MTNEGFIKMMDKDYESIFGVKKKHLTNGRLDNCEYIIKHRNIGTFLTANGEGLRCYVAKEEDAYVFRTIDEAKSIIKWLGLKNDMFTLLKKVHTPTYEKIEW